MKLGQTSIVFFLSKFGSSIVGFVATLYIARMLGAETYGIYVLALTVLAWLKIAGNVGLSAAITKRISEGEDPDAYFVTGFVMMGAIFVLMAVVASLFQTPLESYIGHPVLGLVLLVLFVDLAHAFVSAVLQGRHLVHIYAILDPVKVSLRSLLQIVAVALGFSVGGLLIGYAAAAAVVVGIGLLLTSITYARPTLSHARSLFEYAKYAWLGSLKKQSFSWVDVTVLGFFVSSGLVGVYSIAWSIAAVLTLFSKGISTTLFPEISKLSAEGDRENISGLVTEAVRYNGLFLIPGLVGAVVVGERILLLYGEEFVIGTAVLALLVAARTIYGYQKQLVNAINGINRPDVAFRINAVFIGVNVILNIILIWRFGWVGAAVATAIAATVSLGHAYFSLQGFVDFSFPKTDILHQCTAALLMGVTTIGIVSISPPIADSLAGHLTTVFIVGTGATVYFAILFSISQNFRTTISRNIPVSIPFGRK